MKEAYIKNFVEDTLKGEFSKQLVDSSVTPDELLGYMEIQKGNTINQINDYIEWKTKQVQELSKLPGELDHDKIKNLTETIEKLTEEYNSHFGIERKTQGER